MERVDRQLDAHPHSANPASTHSDIRQRWMRPGSITRRASSAALLTAAVVAGTWLGQSANVSAASPWWPPAGILFAYLAIVGVRGFFPALLARYVALWIVFFDGSGSFLPGQTLIRSAAIVAAYTLVGAMYKRFVAGQAERRRLALFLGLGVVLGPALAGMAAELVDAAFELSTAEVSYESFRTFWVGDAVAVASLSPLLMILGYWIHRREIRFPNRKRLTSRGLLFEVGAIVLAPMLVLWFGSTAEVEPRLALTVLPILWVTMRHRPRIALAGLFLLNSTVAYVATRNLSSASDLLQLQTIMLASAVAALVIGAEVTARETEIERLTTSERRYRRLVDGSPDLIVGFNEGGEIVGQPNTISADDPAVISHIASTWFALPRAKRDHGEVVEHEWTRETTSGPRWYRTRFAKEHDPSETILSITTDLTDVRLAELDLAHAKRHDNLTGLPNRDELLEAMVEADARLRKESGVLTVVHIGLDGFGVINRLHGPAVGDKVLQLTSKRIAEQAPTGCSVARLGGDEFAIAGFLPSFISVNHLVERIVELGRTPVSDRDFDITVTVSAGLATTNEVRTDPAELFRSAELALNAAKEGGGARYVVCDPQLLSDAASRSEILVGLRDAIGTDQLLMHFQPEVDLLSERIVGYEALLRWNHPTRGLLLASEFMAVAEESRLIDDMTHQLIELAIAQLAAFSQVDDQLFMGINLAPTQLEDVDLVGFIASCCDDHGVRPDQVRIEVTETTAMNGKGHAAAVLRRLRDLGVSVAIDDFGTGYASIGYLHQLPVNVVKIDRRYIAHIATDDTDRALVSMVVALAKGLDLRVIAEGIETVEQHNELVGLGCALGQGYGLGRPASGEHALTSYAASLGDGPAAHSLDL